MDWYRWQDLNLQILDPKSNAYANSATPANISVCPECQASFRFVCGSKNPIYTKNVAGIAGIEPTQTESKSVVLPLDYIPIIHRLSDVPSVFPLCHK